MNGKTVIRTASSQVFGWFVEHIQHMHRQAETARRKANESKHECSGHDQEVHDYLLLPESRKERSSNLPRGFAAVKLKGTYKKTTHSSKAELGGILIA